MYILDRLASLNNQNLISQSWNNNLRCHKSIAILELQLNIIP